LFCRHVQPITSERQDPNLRDFSISYAHVTSKLTDSQVLFFSSVRTTLLPLCPVRHLWMAGS